MSIKFALETQELDFIVARMTAGQMDYPTSQNVRNMLQKLQAQANDPAIQGTQKPEPEPPKE